MSNKSSKIVTFPGENIKDTYIDKRKEVDELMAKSESAVKQLELIQQNGGKITKEQVADVFEKLKNSDCGLSELKSIRSGHKENTCFDEVTDMINALSDKELESGLILADKL